MKYFALDVFAYDCGSVWIFEGKGKTAKDFKAAVAVAMRCCVKKAKVKIANGGYVGGLYDAWTDNAEALNTKVPEIVAIFERNGFKVIKPTVIAIDGNRDLNKLEEEIK